MSAEIKTIYEDENYIQIVYPRTRVEAVIDENNNTLDEILSDGLDAKQDKLVSGANIKTVEGTSLLGTGNIDITASNVGLGNVVNTGDSATPVENGTTKFTTGGAYTMQTALQSEIDAKASLASPALTGTPTAPTATTGTSTTQIATTAFVADATSALPTILYGTSAPTSSQGKDGDIYILYSAS